MIIQNNHLINFDQSNNNLKDYEINRLGIWWYDQFADLFIKSYSVF